MMDFPNAPAINQIFGSYVWDGEKWKQITVAAGTPVASVALPLAAGTASAGTASPYSREDHVHPAAGGGGAIARHVAAAHGRRRRGRHLE